MSTLGSASTASYSTSVYRMSAPSDELVDARATRVALTVNLLMNMRATLLGTVSCCCCTLLVASLIDDIVRKVGGRSSTNALRGLVGLGKDDMIAVVNEAYGIALQRGAMDVRKRDLVNAYVRWTSKSPFDVPASRA